MFPAIHVYCIGTVETRRMRRCAAASLFPTSYSMRSSWLLSINTTETSKCYKSGFLIPSLKSQFLKITSTPSYTLHCHSFREPSES